MPPPPCVPTGQYEEAVKCFTAALGLDPALADAWKRRGQCQAARGGGFCRAALADLDHAKVSGEEWGGVGGRLSFKDDAEASVLSSSCWRLLVGARSIVAVVPSFWVTSCPRRCRRRPQIIDAASSGGPRDADILHQRGSVLHRLGEFKLAAAEFEAFVRREPGHAVGWNYVGLCRAQLGDLDAGERRWGT